LRESYRKMYIALNIKDIDALLPPEAEVPARDPISEQQAAMTGNPIKAYPFQNHDAYIASHSSFMQNPMIQQNPSASQAIGANIQEHQSMLYRQQIEQAMGQPLPQLEEGQMPPEVMNEIAMMAAQATQQVTGQAQAMAQAAQAAQQNPQMEMFQQQMQLEKEQLAQKAEDDMRDAELVMAKAQLDAQVKREKIEADQRVADTKTAIDLQELEQKAKADAEKNYTELVKTVRESRKQNGEK